MPPFQRFVTKNSGVVLDPMSHWQIVQPFQIYLSRCIPEVNYSGFANSPLSLTSNTVRQCLYVPSPLAYSQHISLSGPTQIKPHRDSSLLSTSQPLSNSEESHALYNA